MPSLIEKVQDKIIQLDLNSDNLKMDLRDIKKEISDYFGGINSLLSGAFSYLKLHNISEDKNSTIETCCKIISGELSSKLSPIIENKAKEIYTFILTGKRKEKDIANIYGSIREEIKKILSDEVIKEKLEKIVEDSKALDFIEKISDHLFHNVLKKKIQKQLKSDIEKLIFLETSNKVDKQGYNLFHLACETGSIALMQYLLEQGWEYLYKEGKKDKSDPILFTIAEKDKELKDFLKKSEPKVIYKGKVVGLIARMRALTSPAKKIAFVGRHGFTFNEDNFETDVKEKIRPVDVILNKESGENKKATIVITPGDSALLPTWDIIINIDDPEKVTAVTVFLNEEKADPEIQIPSEILKKDVPDKLPINTKENQEIVAEIDKKRIKRWEKFEKKQKDTGRGRYRDQKETMGRLTAAEVARAAGFLVVDDSNWQWCHLIAYSMGGEDGEKPKNELEYEMKGPQREHNLVLGTVEANAQMLVVESIIKSLVKKVNGIIRVRIKPTFVKGLEKYHVAEKLQYTIEDDKKRQITFSFNMLSRRKTALQEPKIIGPILEGLFLKGHQLTDKLKKEIESLSEQLITIESDEEKEPSLPLQSETKELKKEEESPFLASQDFTPSKVQRSTAPTAITPLYSKFHSKLEELTIKSESEETPKKIKKSYSGGSDDE